MKSLSVGMQAHVAQDVTTLCTCWKITRKDGVILGFTDHDQDIIYSGTTYKSSSGFRRSAVANDSTLAVDNLDILGILDDTAITASDLRKGVYDYAAFEVFLLNWADTSMGQIKIRKGNLGEVVVTPKGTFKSELRGLAQRLNYTFVELYQPSCRADLGDTRCGVDLGPYTFSGTVSGVTSNRVFQTTTNTEADDYYNGGFVRWLTGDNADAVMEVKDWQLSTNEVSLFLPMPFDIQIGDTFEMVLGCDKTRERCKFFNNIINFRGEPDVPGQDAVLEYPDAT